MVSFGNHIGALPGSGSHFLDAPPNESSRSWQLASRWRLETKVFGKPHYLQVVQAIFSSTSLVFTKTYQNNFPALVQVQVRLFKTQKIGRILDHGNHGPGNSQETSTSSTKISPENPLGSKNIPRYPQIGGRSAHFSKSSAMPKRHNGVRRDPQPQNALPAMPKRTSPPEVTSDQSVAPQLGLMKSAE